MAKPRGFSLLEILVVIVIIALIAVFGHQEYLSYVQRSKITEALHVLEEYQTMALGQRARKGKMEPYYVLFTDGDQTGLITGSPGGTSASKSVNLKYVDKVEAYSGTAGSNTYLLLGAQLQHDGIFVDDADHVYLVGIETPAGVLTWSCGISTSQANTINPDYLPQTCRTSLP